MYADILREKLMEQKQVYKMFKENDTSLVCYKEEHDKNYGQMDANYINRMRLSYYLFYEKIDDEDTVAALFEEELKDRETNSFQGIGSTLQLLTCLLRQYNNDGRYNALFTRAQNANFDCACGYSTGLQIDNSLYSNSLQDCIYLAWDLDYKDVAGRLTDEWIKTIKNWNKDNIKTLISFNNYLGRELENEKLYKQLLSFLQPEDSLQHTASSYIDIIRYYTSIKKYHLAYEYINKLVTSYNLDEIKHIRLYTYLLEAGMEVICNVPDLADTLWEWIKPELQKQDMFGNLYIKGIAAAKAVNDPFALELEKDYTDWKKAYKLKLDEIRC